MHKLPLYLIGFMASGKSKVGKKLAKKLELEFIDLDQLIEKESGKTITEIFKDKGEEHFRSLEKSVLRQTKGKNAVVALGGGTVCYFDNMDFVKKNGTSIYLNISSDVLYGRLRRNKNSRPLVRDLNDEELKLFVAQKLNEREAYYRRADYILLDNNLTVNKIINLLIS